MRGLPEQSWAHRMQVLAVPLMPASGNRLPRGPAFLRPGILALMRALMVAVLSVCLAGCAVRARSGAELKRTGDEIVVCGRYFHTGTPVVLWTDPGGYDAYR